MMNTNSSKKTQKKKLGRGLNALFSDHQIIEDDKGSVSRIEEIRLNEITPNPFQPRQTFNEEEIAELAKTIEDHGLISPIVVRKHEGGYQIVLGERRFRAHQLLEKETIKAEVKTMFTDKQMAEVALIENIQRVQLTPIEEAVAFERLINEHGYTHEQVAESVGKSRSAITNTLRLLKLPDDVQEWVNDEKLSAGHARALLRPEVTDVEAMARQIMYHGLNVREAEEIAKTGDHEITNSVTQIKQTPVKDPNVVNFERELEYALGTSVKLMGNTKKGKLTINYSGLGDLERIAAIIKGGSEFI